MLRMNTCVPGKIDRIQNGRDRFSENYEASSKGELQNMRNPLHIYGYFF
jgi:hypothetical protein